MAIKIGPLFVESTRNLDDVTIIVTENSELIDNYMAIGPIVTIDTDVTLTVTGDSELVIL